MIASLYGFVAATWLSERGRPVLSRFKYALLPIPLGYLLLWVRFFGGASILVEVLLTAIFLLAYLRDRGRLMMGLITVLLIIFICESGVYMLERGRGEAQSHYSSPTVVRDPALGVAGIPNADYLWSRTLKADELFRVHVTLDEKGFRVSEPSNAGAARHAFFFGGSFTFGWSAEDRQTLPSQFARRSPEHEVYNLSIHGGGAGQMLALLRDPSLIPSAGRRPGFALYFYIPDHIWRIAGDVNHLYPVGYHEFFPLFRRLEGGELSEPFRYSDRPAMRRLSQLHWRLKNASPLARLALGAYRIKFVSRGEALEIFAQAVIESRRAYGRNFDGAFYFLIWPGEELGGSDRETQILRDRLEPEGVVVIEVEGMEDSSRWTIPRDGHPTAEALGRIAQRLVEVIEDEKRANEAPEAAALQTEKRDQS